MEHRYVSINFQLKKTPNTKEVQYRPSTDNWVAPIIWSLCLLLSLDGYAQDCQDRVFSDIKYLAADGLMGRVPGSRGDSLSQQFLIHRFTQLGFQIQTRSLTVITSTKDTVITQNIIASANENSTSKLIVGAHFDHIDSYSSKSRDLIDGEIHNGADDNASGIALMLQLAERISDKSNVEFVAFGGHEEGLFGSQHYLQTALEESKFNKQPVVMINLDMVGRLNPTQPTCKVYYQNIEQTRLEEQQKLLEQSDLNFKWESDSQYHSDDKPFFERGVSTLFFTSGAHQDHHRSTDTAEKINYAGICELSHEIIEVIEVFQTEFGDDD